MVVKLFTFHTAESAVMDPSPVNGGRLSPAYTIEVRYRTADHHERQVTHLAAA